MNLKNTKSEPIINKQNKNKIKSLKVFCNSSPGHWSAFVENTAPAPTDVKITTKAENNIIKNVLDGCLDVTTSKYILAYDVLQTVHSKLFLLFIHFNRHSGCARI